MDDNKYLFRQLLLLICITVVYANWGSPTSGQYHIQTDEGPERYFRYQTDNGQFRKEKRLQDGTVIGTDAWIDDSGYLRQNDYIADHKGYRILKSKTVFVGKGRPIQEAMKYAKNSTTNSIFGESSFFSKTFPKKKLHHTTKKPSTVLPIRSDVIIENPLGYDHYRDDQPLRKIQIHHNSQPIEDTYLPAVRTPAYHNIIETTTVRPSLLYLNPNVKHHQTDEVISSPEIYHHNKFNVPSNQFEPPFNSIGDNGNGIENEPIAVFPPSSTPATPGVNYGTPIAVYHPSSSSSTTPRPFNHYSQTSSSNPLTNYYPSSTASSQALQTPSSHYSGISSTTSRPFFDDSTISSTPNSIITDINNNYIDRQSPFLNRNQQPSSLYSRYPAVSQRRYPSYQQNYPNQQIGNGYDRQFSLYDGVSATANGFRYYLPRQYHEEESNTDGQRRDGSFGYIDPFGIRRVIYYNTSPESGFVHRKNNRYVGFNATPYDPRPL